MSDFDLHSNIRNDAKELINQLATCIASGGRLSLMGPNLYDTAWVSMLAKEDGTNRYWAFPLAFDLVAAEQARTGGWHACGTEADLILINAVCLLALLHHKAHPEHMGYTSNGPEVSLDALIQDTETFLQQRLACFDPNAVEAVGFEFLLPAILNMVDDHFTQPPQLQLDRRPYASQHACVTRMAAKRSALLTRLEPEIFYSAEHTTKIHSLEAFVGLLDYNRLRHRCESGNGMMGSPSSTAAYLMNASNWDDQAEAFLACSIDSSGGFPGASPTTTFEAAWILSTLLLSGFTGVDLCSEGLDQVSQFLGGELTRNGGIVGFAPEFMEDADDTAKSILSLLLLRKQSMRPCQDNRVAALQIDRMVQTFWHREKGCFRTYSAERNASFSTNCNVLMALLHSDDSLKYWTEIGASMQWLLDTWNDSPVQDKWNISPLYSHMLLSQVLVFFMKKRKELEGSVPLVDLDRPFKVLIQMTGDLLSSQQDDGSWSHPIPGSQSVSVEPTSYALLALCSAREVACPTTIDLAVDEAVGRGFRWLLQKYQTKIQAGDKHFDFEHLWIAKVTYQSPQLCELYCLAALRASSYHTRPSLTGSVKGVTMVESPVDEQETDQRNNQADSSSNNSGGDAIADTPDSSDAELISEKSRDRLISFLSLLPLFAEDQIDYTARGHPSVQDAVLDSQSYLPRLEARIEAMMPSDGLSIQATAKTQEYLSFIPATWIAVKKHLKVEVQDQVLFDMMVVSLLTYRVDEFMDGPVSKLLHQYPRAMTDVRKIVDALCEPHVTHDPVVNLDALHPAGAELAKIAVALERFTTFVVLHPLVRKSSAWMQRYICQNLKSFLAAHLEQIEANWNYRLGPRQTLNSWLRGPSADSTSGPYAFAFFIAMIGGSEAKLFQGATTKYLLEAVARHLSMKCRICNDCGSLQRDREECELNALDFPEFADPHFKTSCDSSEAKRHLLELASYEQECLDHAMDRLEKEVDSEVMAQIKLFARVTELYNQIYLRRDLSKRKE